MACSALFASHVVRRICNAVGLRRRSTVGEPTCPVALHHRSSPRSVFRPRVVDSLVWRFTLVCRSPARWGSVVCCRTVRGAGSLIVRRRHSGLDRSAAAGMALLPEYGGARTACGEEAGRPIHKSRSPPDPPHPGELRAPLGAAEPSPPGAVQHCSGELLEARGSRSDDLSHRHRHRLDLSVRRIHDPVANRSRTRSSDKRAVVGSSETQRRIPRRL